VRSALRRPPPAALLLLGCLAGCSAASSPAGSTAADAAATCADPGGAVAGPADDHCASAGPDGGDLALVVDPSLCTALPPDDAGIPACAYLPTRYGNEADDDDCKYHVAWSSSPVCSAPGSVTFTVALTSLADGKPVTGAAPAPEVFTTTPGDWDAAGYCDDDSTTPGTAGTFVEGPVGTYVGPITFSQSGQWTVRFHFFPTCDHWPSSPHGHVAFHVRVP
jgi:hypothetical protein